MFVKIVALHCDQDNSYQISMNGYQARKINVIGNLIFWSLAKGDLPQC